MKIFSMFLFGLCALGFLLWVFQRKLIYFPDTSKPNLNNYQVKGMEEVNFKTKDGLLLYAWYKKPSLKNLTLVYFHGNAGHLGGRMPLVKDLINEGYGVFIMSYRGYAGNPGSPTEEGLYLDGRAAMDFLTQQKADCVAIFGESLGTAVATQMATEYPVKALILQAPFSSLLNVANYHYPFTRLVPPADKFDSISKIASIKAPLLIIHGRKDEVVPFSHGKAMFDKASGEREIFELPMRGHNNLWGPEFYNKLNLYLNRINSRCARYG